MFIAHAILAHMLIGINSQLDAVIMWMYRQGFDILVILGIGVLVYYVGKRLLGQIVKRVILSGHHKDWQQKDIEKRQRTLKRLFATIWRMLVLLAVGYAVILKAFPDASTVLAPLFASAGIVGIALGFGAQSLIKDFLSGIFIISENQYRIGDIIDIEGYSGTVEQIGTRSTVIRDVDGNVHYFPNGMVQHVINKTMGYSMARFSVALHPSTDLEVITEVINAIGQELAKEKTWEAKIIEAPSFVSIGEFNANSVELIIAGKTQPSDQWAVTAEMRRRLLKRFEDQGVRLAAPPPQGRTKK
jgi:small-conductance mechanosensitive channel